MLLAIAFQHCAKGFAQYFLGGLAVLITADTALCAPDRLLALLFDQNQRQLLAIFNIAARGDGYIKT